MEKERKSRFSPETVERLRELYREHTAKECAGIIGLPVNSVNYLLMKHGIRLEGRNQTAKAKMPPQARQQSVPIAHWKKQMEESIRQEYNNVSTADMAEETGANYYTVARNAIRMGIGKSKPFMRNRWSAGGRYRLSEERRHEMEEYLKKHFGDTANAELAERFGVDVKTIRRYARQLGLQKSSEFMYMSRGKGRAGKNFYTEEFLAWRTKRIAEVYPCGSEQQLQALQEELGLELVTIKNIARRNGIHRTKEDYYDKELVDAVREYFPTHTDKECAEHFGVKKKFIQSIARKYGFYKSASHLQGVYDENVRRWQQVREKKKNAG